MKLTYKEKKACKTYAQLTGYQAFRGIRNKNYVKFVRKVYANSFLPSYQHKILHINVVLEFVKYYEK